MIGLTYPYPDLRFVGMLPDTAKKYLKLNNPKEASKRTKLRTKIALVKGAQDDSADFTMDSRASASSFGNTDVSTVAIEEPTSSSGARNVPSRTIPHETPRAAGHRKTIMPNALREMLLEHNSTTTITPSSNNLSAFGGRRMAPPARSVVNESEPALLKPIKTRAFGQLGTHASTPSIIINSGEMDARLSTTMLMAPATLKKGGALRVLRNVDLKADEKEEPKDIEVVNGEPLPIVF